MTNPRRTTSVTVLGLGALGSAIARAFLEHGHQTTVWNRSPDRAGDLVARGATVAATPAEAVAAGDLVVICVLDYPAVHEILAAAGDAVTGRVIVNVTTGTPADALATAELLPTAAGYLDGAVLANPRHIGGPESILIYSGTTEAFTATESTLGVLGHSTHLGEAVDLAAVYDIALLGMGWSALAGFLHGAAMTGDAAVFTGLADRWLRTVSAMMSDYGRQVAEGDYPGTEETVELNDLGLGLLVEASRRQGVAPDLPNALKGLTERALAAGHGGRSFASVVEVLRGRGEPAVSSGP